jgi:hypothetical protein
MSFSVEMKLRKDAFCSGLEQRLVPIRVEQGGDQLRCCTALLDASPRGTFGFGVPPCRLRAMAFVISVDRRRG